MNDKSPAPRRTTAAELEDEQERDDAIIGIALKYSAVALLLLGSAAAGAWWWLRPDTSVEVTKAAPIELPETRVLPEVEIPSMPFTDITESAGIRFVHNNGAFGEKLLPETMGGGCAFLDYNGDGAQDILLVNSRRWPWDPRRTGSPEATHALYANDGQGNFTDVTHAAGLAISMYGMGVAVGDFDNDGDPDLFFTGLGRNRLFRNDGGTYVDVTDAAGVAGGAHDWSTSAGWFDYDNDGDLDLWVCNYIVWSREFDLAQPFTLTGSDRAYGRPQDFEGTFSQLFRNDGDGTFTDVSAEAGIQIRNPTTGVPMGKSLGLMFSDIDGDGYLDVIVANDTVQNFLFRNRGDGTFEEIGALAGVAFDISGNARGAMGIDAAQFREGEDCLGIAIGNFANEMTALYVSIPGTTQFSDDAIANGLGPNTRLQLTFAVFFIDADLDGRLDLFAANGHLEEDIAKVQASQTYEQSPQLFWNAGAAHATEFVPLTAEHLGNDFVRPLVGRGASYADIDGDGDLDILIAATGQKPRLLRNDQQAGGHWLRMQLEGNGVTTNREAIGAVVTIEAGGRTQTRTVTRTRGYLSQSERPVTFGLGDAEVVERVEIRWPDGSVQTLTDLAVDQLHKIAQP
ncbi:MAG: CRTAC1 family protein [Maioricimonas sp. JB049]